MSNGHEIQVGWDRPLDLDWDFQLDALRREIADAAPGGGSGALKQAFRSEDTAVINDNNTEITIHVGKQHKAWRYAAIQNFGGPERDVVIRPVKAKALRFYWNGVLRFFKQVTIKAGSILGSNYVEKGAFAWVRDLKREGFVKWAGKHHSAGIGRHGRSS